MPLPPPSETCFAFEIDLAFLLSLSIELPGGAAIMPKFDFGEVPNAGTVIAKLLGELNAALTPLVPFFRLLDVVIALIECVKAIPDSLGPPPDPTKLVKCISKLTAAASFLLKLVPMLSVPIMIVGICKVIIGGLMALREQLAISLQANIGLEAMRIRASLLAEDEELVAGAAALEASIDCAQANIDFGLEAGGVALNPLNKLIQLLNLFMGMAGLPEIGAIDMETPDLSAGVDLDAALKPLDLTIDVLLKLCDSIPV